MKDINGGTRKKVPMRTPVYNWKFEIVVDPAEAIGYLQSP